MPSQPLRFIVACFTVSAILSVAGCDLMDVPQVASIDSTADIQNVGLKNQIPNEGIVLVKFGATWCGPCKQMDKSLEQLESELPQAAQIVKIDVDENTDAASEFQVNGIPHTFMFNDGELVSERVGYVDTKGLISWIKSRD